MKDVEPTAPAQPAVSFAGLLEKVEIMRSSLRWPQTLARPQIERLLGQANKLREEVLKLSRTERLVQATANASPKASAQAEKTVADRRAALLDRDFQFDGVFGDCPALIEALEIAEKAAPTDLPVLIDGESGTGKELMAKVVHANGSRADQPLITVNCGAIPDNLLESELFGHKRGAFTGASSDRAGKFESANGGTIFLDEIGELPLIGQVKLLRVLQSNEIQRVGSDKVVHVDARVVAATNKDLLKMCAEGTFREDLYYRLSIIQVTIPPLRERRDELPLLLDFLVQEAAQRLDRSPVQLTARLKDFLMHYEFPGNIRELRNILFRLSCLAGDEGDVEHLPPQLRASRAEAEAGATPRLASVVFPGDQSSAGAAAQSSASLASAAGDSASSRSLTALDIDQITLTEAKRVASDQAEKRYLQAGLARTDGNVTELSRRIDMNRAHVQTLLKKHSISSKDYRGQRAAAASGKA